MKSVGRGRANKHSAVVKRFEEHSSTIGQGYDTVIREGDANRTKPKLEMYPTFYSPETAFLPVSEQSSVLSKKNLEKKPGWKHREGFEPTTSGTYGYLCTM